MTTEGPWLLIPLVKALLYRHPLHHRQNLPFVAHRTCLERAQMAAPPRRVVGVVAGRPPAAAAGRTAVWSIAGQRAPWGLIAVGVLEVALREACVCV